MTPQQIEQKRKHFFIGVSVIATVITLVSASATFKINQRSFVDWGAWGDLLAFLATVGTEAAFSLALYGVTYALTSGAEKKLGVTLLIGAVLVMATNYVVHHKTNIAAKLGDWQTAYVEWIGPLSLFGILLVIVGIIVYNRDAQKRSQEREYAYSAERKALQWRQDQLESAEFGEYMDQFRDQVYDDARRMLKLPAASGANASADKTIGFRERDEDHGPKGQSDQG